MSLPEPFALFMRDHAATGALVEDARGQVEAAIVYDDDPTLVPAAVAALRTLQQLLRVDLERHIRREEDALLPAFQALARNDELIHGMLTQHRRIEERREVLGRLIAALDHDHEELDQARGRLAEALATPVLTVADLQRLVDGVRQLDWMLQGHFGDEEDDLLVPGADLFTGEARDQLAAAIERIQ